MQPMQHACSHFMGAAPGFHSDPTSLLSSLWPLGMLGLLFAGVLATLFLLLWTTHYEQPAHADNELLASGERQWSESRPDEPGPHISFARYEPPSQQHQASYEQPQAHYPEMPPDEPPQPGKYD